MMKFKTIERQTLITDIAVAGALAKTSNSTEEYLRWLARESELRMRADVLMPAEQDAIDQIERSKVLEYDQSAAS